jgi:preprotein translocase subunit SecD
MATTSRKPGHPLRTVSVFAGFIALLYIIIAATGSWELKLGLDLRGGTTITMTAKNTTGEGAVSTDSLELAKSIISQRVDSMGVGETEVTTQGTDKIVVSVPNVQEDELLDMVGQTAQLYFRRVYAVTDPNGEVTGETSPTATDDTSGTNGSDDSTAILTDEDGNIITDEDGNIVIDDTTVADEDATDETAADETATDEAAPEPEATADGRPLPQLPSPVPSPRPTVPANPQPDLETLLNYEMTERDFSDYENFTCGDTFPDVVDQPLISCTEPDEYGYQYKLLLGPALIRGDQLTEAQASVPQNSVSWVVNLQFNDEGTTAFDTVTQFLSEQTEPVNEFAIVLDSTTISFPRVENPIPGGRAEISGSFTQKSATQLANVLKYGALPLSFTVDSVDNVSAKLGGDQLTVGIIAGLIGLGLVVLYAIIYYHGLFVVVVASLGIAGVLTYACMAILGQSIGFALNLPGIAGAIVAVGVTADSFIIFFERIRDEVREGRSLVTGIESGWKSARKTILAADSVSLLSAVTLYILAVGSVKGFAFTLGLTTLIDIAIVFWFTKPMMALLAKTKFWGEGRRFSGFEADHLGKRTPLHSGVGKPLAAGAAAGATAAVEADAEGEDGADEEEVEA